jgi:hypothetical protein
LTLAARKPLLIEERLSRYRDEREVDRMTEGTADMLAVCASTAPSTAEVGLMATPPVFGTQSVPASRRREWLTVYQFR